MWSNHKYIYIYLQIVDVQEDCVRCLLDLSSSFLLAKPCLVLFAATYSSFSCPGRINSPLLSDIIIGHVTYVCQLNVSSCNDTLTCYFQKNS